MSDDLIDPAQKFFMAAQVTQDGRPDRIDFGIEIPTMAADEATLIAACRATARQCGGRYYVFEVRPVRRLTKATMKVIK